jgi:hypothetical protein
MLTPRGFWQFATQKQDNADLLASGNRSSQLVDPTDPEISIVLSADQD